MTMSSDAINVGLLGYGVVGCGAYRVLTDNAASIARRAAGPIIVRRIADIDWQRERDVWPPEGLRTTDAKAVIDDPDVHILVEVIGGTEPAREFVLAAIRRGKSIVTSNKELMAKHGSEILDAAKDAHVDVEFEGSAGGAIPVVRSLKESLEADHITEIVGILNGTTNYILTRMTADGLPFEQALANAKELGYAEPDPTNDIEGHDPAYKIAILASIAFGKRIDIDQVYREGISHIAPEDIDYAEGMGYAIKLLAIAKNGEDDIDVRVHPALLPHDHPLASVNDVFNAVLIRGRACDQIMLYGRGAGGLPTGTAVVADIVSAARNIRHGAAGRVVCTCEGQAAIRPPADVQSRNYLRLAVKDRPGVMGAIATIFGEESVSIESVVQKGSLGDSAEIVWVTHAVTGHAFRSALDRIGKLPVVERICSAIRVEA
jgi:homoserine dehydrogenase